ncbi:MAG: hypothetical protein LKJ63_03375 [Acetobacter fabarum]|nr:hypothetical protein [Acetobacter fabarum]
MNMQGELSASHGPIFAHCVKLNQTQIAKLRLIKYSHSAKKCDMDIRAYLKGEKATLSSMAKKLECSVTTLHGYASGRRSVPLRIVLKVEELTGGQVKPADWILEPGKDRGQAA